ncbi:MAG: hypothetical protein LBV12_06045 [Puniceicoccales bacterium]|jgi:hypothetical protein|nr:hypothetical protein [Puniceicoccales bacterium]
MKQIAGLLKVWLGHEYVFRFLSECPATGDNCLFPDENFVTQKLGGDVMRMFYSPEWLEMSTKRQQLYIVKHSKL